MTNIKDIEKAIERLKICLDCDDCMTCGEHDKAIEIAIEVMQEKVEMDKGFNLFGEMRMLTCDELKKKEEMLLQISKPTGVSFFESKDCEWCDYFVKSQNLISLGNGQYKEVPHKYCGNCGKEL